MKVGFKNYTVKGVRMRSIFIKAWRVIAIWSKELYVFKVQRQRRATSLGTFLGNLPGLTAWIDSLELRGLFLLVGSDGGLSFL